MAEYKAYGTGRRKLSISRVFLNPNGKGEITVNGKSYKDYFPEYFHHVVEAPLDVTGTLGKFDLKCTIKGGGVSGQAEALRHGISRALNAYDEEKYRKTLKNLGYLTRDQRMIERKKFGLRKARKKEQYSKR